MRKGTTTPENTFPNRTMYPIADKVPYYAFMLGAGALETSDGPTINARAEIVDYANRPISGLHGAGNCIASPSREAYCGAGATIGLAMTSGCLAGRNAATRGVHRGAIAAAVLAPATIGTASSEEGVSFSADIAPILNDHCVTCHVTGTEPGHMPLYSEVAYQFLVGVPSEESPLKRVEPGDPDTSYVVHKLNGTHVSVGGSGQQMRVGDPPLPLALQAKIRQWIAAGAPND